MAATKHAITLSIESQREWPSLLCAKAKPGLKFNDKWVRGNILEVGFPTRLFVEWITLFIAGGQVKR
jgi:hypothetical protein